ncbi:histidine--tRNA ligase [Candidatus Daviesbacteria bacterium]|nr:histidine--tRNA ligase [Candidatus Daviesbacteria bacterium]
MIKPVTPKGFRDIKPELAKLRREVIGKIAGTLEKYGFEPIETPTIEFAETLKGKYGEEERLIYEFTDRGDRKLALRYDLTVPLARYVATYNPQLPFRRYQVGQVFRGENPQRGRWREFTQFDFDTVGSTDPEEDAKIVAVATQCFRQLGLKSSIMLVNDRENFASYPTEVARAIDKLYKIGEGGVLEELTKAGKSKDEAQKILDQVKSTKPTENLLHVFKILEENYNLKEGTDFAFDPTLVRGLDYYTGLIFEMKPSNDPADLTIGAGGRYDNLIGTFTKKDIPAVGFSFGLDRLIDTLDDQTSKLSD